MPFKQDLYWCNLPAERDKNNASVIRNTFLSKCTDPFIVFTGTNTLDFNRLLKNKIFCKKIKKRHLQIFLYEPISYYFVGEKYNLGFYSEFHHKFNHNENLRAEELDWIQKFAEKLDKKITVNLCDWRIPDLFKSHYPHLILQTKDIFVRQVSYSDAVNNLTNTNIKKKFWCGNARYTIHRHIIMCYLAHFSGNYSWFFSTHTNWQEAVNWIGHLPFSYLESGNEQLKKKDLFLDQKQEKVNIEKLSNFHIPEEIQYHSTHGDIYDKKFDECFCPIINETRFAQPSANFSEKVLYAIARYKPFILVAPPFTLEYMKKLGFLTFNKWWDESYDLEENHSHRLRKIFSQINRINSLEISELEEMYKEMMPVLQHNNRMLKSLRKDDSTLNAYKN